MSKKSDKEDLKAVKAVETIMKYCDSRVGCNECVFHILDLGITINNCMIGTKIPACWDAEDTIRFYKEANE